MYFNILGDDKASSLLVEDIILKMMIKAIVETSFE